MSSLWAKLNADGRNIPLIKNINRKEVPQSFPHIIPQAQWRRIKITKTFPFIAPAKRMSPFISSENVFARFQTYKEGSMTIEACLALPLFLFFMINVLSLFLMFHTFITDLEAIHQQGRELAMYSYLGDKDLQKDLIRLGKTRRIEPIIPLIGYPGTRVTSHCYMHAWTGYDVEHRSTGDIEDRYVFITETGSVYHTARSCSHLNLSISLVGAGQIPKMRNQAGGKYYPCERCGGNSTEMVYVTQDGDRYHNTAGCSGLKRTVIVIPISQIGSRQRCMRCG